MGFLLSGLIGAIIASLLSVLYQYIAEQIRRRAELMMEIVKWADDIYERLQILTVNKGEIYAGKEAYLTQEEFKMVNREVKITLLSSRISAMVALVYGEGKDVQRINTLQGELLKVARIQWNSKKETWPQASKEIDEKFDKIIDPLREAIANRFLAASRPPAVISDFFKRYLPTFYKMRCCIKKKIVLDK